MDFSLDELRAKRQRRIAALNASLESSSSSSSSGEEPDIVPYKRATPPMEAPPRKKARIVRPSRIHAAQPAQKTRQSSARNVKSLFANNNRQTTGSLDKDTVETLQLLGVHRTASKMSEKKDEQPTTTEKVEEAVACEKCHDGRSLGTNKIVYCDGCNKTYHQRCHIPNISKVYVKDINKQWFCSDCSSEDTPAIGKEADSVSGQKETPTQPSSSAKKAKPSAANKDTAAQPGPYMSLAQATLKGKAGMVIDKDGVAKPWTPIAGFMRFPYIARNLGHQPSINPEDYYPAYMKTDKEPESKDKPDDKPSDDKDDMSMEG